MKSIKYILASAVVAVVAAVSMTGSASAVAANKCTVADKGLAMGKSGQITVSGNTASVTYTVKGENCSTPVSIAVWKRVSPEGISDQKLFASKTIPNVTPGTYTTTINLPNCLYQVDLVEGANPTADDGTANYVKAVNGKWVGNLRDFIKPAGTNVCVDQPPVTPPTTVTVTKEVVKEVPVTKMPSTGAGDILAGTTGLSTTVGVAYNLIRRKKLLR